MKQSIDINADVGESFGAYRIGADEALLPLITSANIACGFHAGDPTVMRRTIELALAHGVAVGAHPGLPDLAGFGRREMAVSPGEVYDMVIYQVGALQGAAAAAGARVRHIKPHGALYNMAAARRPLADAIARAVRDVDASLILFGLSNSRLVEAAEAHGLRAAHEVFADRHYRPDGTLVARDEAGGLIEDPVQAGDRVVAMVREGTVPAVSGEHVALRADTACIHGDGPNAVAMARQVRDALERAGIAVRAPS